MRHHLRFASIGWSVAILVLILLAGPGLGIASAGGGTWATKQPLLMGRIGLQAETLDGAVYAIGGVTGGCPEPPALESEAYDPATNCTWGGGGPARATRCRVERGIPRRGITSRALLSRLCSLPISRHKQILHTGPAVLDRAA